MHLPQIGVKHEVGHHTRMQESSNFKIPYSVFWASGFASRTIKSAHRTSSKETRCFVDRLRL